MTQESMTLFPEHIRGYLNNDEVRHFVRVSGLMTNKLKSVETIQDLREIAYSLISIANGYQRCADTWERK